MSFITPVYYVSIGSAIKIKSAKTASLIGTTLLAKYLSLIVFANVPFVDDYKLNNNSLVIYFISSAILMYFIKSRISSRHSYLNLFRRRVFWAYTVIIINAAVTFFRHQVQGVAYQYSFSSLCQWSAIALDIYFENLFNCEIRHLELRIAFPLDKASRTV